MNASIKHSVGCLAAGVLLYALLIVPFSGYMRSKPIEEKLGYLPNINLIRYMSADHKEFVAASLVMKVVMYFGGLLEKQQSNVMTAPPDFQTMSRILHGAVQLDPYNMDAYYFAQSFLTWDVKQFKVANELLDYGMRYRTWDWYLPFFAGFNHAYFLKDYAKAAEYYKRAGELSGHELHISLSSRYLQEAGQTEHAIGYLKAMIATSRNETAKKSFEIRLKAFEAVQEIEQARDRFFNKHRRLPVSVEELLLSGNLKVRPTDPYGGVFYLNNDGRVATTSKFAFGGKR